MGDHRLDRTCEMPAVPQKSHGQEQADRLQQRLAEISHRKVKLTVAAVLFNGLLFLAILTLAKFDIERAQKTFSNVFLYQIVGWTTWFIYPYFLRMEAKSDMGLAMSRDSVDILSDVDREFELRLARIDRILGTLEHSLTSIDQGDHPLVKRFEAIFHKEMGLLRTEVSRAQGQVNSELEAALAEGEAEAAAQAEAPEEAPGIPTAGGL